MTYSDKLKDPRWQKKRLEIMKRDDFTCKYCGDKTTSLNIHHSYYRGEPWESPNESLITLCEDCHEVVSAGKLKGILSGIKLKKKNGIQLFIFNDNSKEYLLIIGFPDSLRSIRITQDEVENFKQLINFIK